MTLADRSFKRAKWHLGNLKTARSNKPPTSTSSHRQAVSLPNGAPTFRGIAHIERMKEWLQRLGHTDRAINELNVIHVAGTKGKGSTCAYVESILQAHGKRTGFPARIGLYTSPHIIEYTERIRIDAAPLSEEKFAENFFEIWDRLRLQHSKDGPRSLQLLALLSYHTFIKEQVDVAIYETHHGGEYDVTNIIEEPVVTAITSIGLDHVKELGPTIENIAWHKGGIFKQGAHAISAPQVPEVARVLTDRAAEKENSLQFVEVSEDLTDIRVPSQRINASLARAACLEFIRRQHATHALSLSDIQCGVENFAWPGRFQTIQRRNILWCLDGAHNPMSGSEAANWFGTLSEPPSTVKRLLVFGLDSDRHDGPGTLESLLVLGGDVSRVIFTSDTGKSDTSGARVREYEAIWRRNFPDTEIATIVDTDRVLDEVHGAGEEACNVHVLVTGSLYLVGSVLKRLSC